MTPWVLRLLLANVVIFLISGSSPLIFNLGALVPAGIFIRPWTPITYMFLHAGFGHLFFNMLGLFFFGPRLEDRLGGRGFLVLYFLSGLMAALFSFIFAFRSPVVGASGAVFGVLLGFAWFWPKENIYIWGVLPVQARYLIGFLVVVSLWSGLSGAQDNVAHFAHIGGFVGGWFYLWLRGRRQGKAKREWQQQIQPEVKASPVAEAATLQRWKSTISLDQLHELNREEVRGLLVRAEEEGVRSLKADERAFLDRMAKI